jgi:hypothetical protein
LLSASIRVSSVGCKSNCRAGRLLSNSPDSPNLPSTAPRPNSAWFCFSCSSGPAFGPTRGGVAQCSKTALPRSRLGQERPNPLFCATSALPPIASGIAPCRPVTMCHEPT